MVLRTARTSWLLACWVPSRTSLLLRDTPYFTSTLCACGREVIQRVGCIWYMHTPIFSLWMFVCMYHLSVCLFVVCVCWLCFCACARPLFDVRYSQCPSHYASGLSGLSTWGWLKQKSTLLEEDSSVRIVANATMNTYKVSLSLPKQSQNIVCTQHTFRGFAKRVTHTSSACSRSMLQAWRQQSSRNARTRRRGRWAIRGPPASFLSAFALCF
jgi:hypothetical protein